MTVGELVKHNHDTIIVYKQKNDYELEFDDLYRGRSDNIPESIRKMNIITFGARRANITEIEVE